MTKYLLDKKQGAESRTCLLLCLKQSLNCRVTVTFVLYLWASYLYTEVASKGWRMVKS